MAERTGRTTSSVLAWTGHGSGPLDSLPQSRALHARELAGHVSADGSIDEVGEPMAGPYTKSDVEDGKWRVHVSVVDDADRHSQCYYGAVATKHQWPALSFLPNPNSDIEQRPTHGRHIQVPLSWPPAARCGMKVWRKSVPRFWKQTWIPRSCQDVPTKDRINEGKSESEFVRVEMDNGLLSAHKRMTLQQPNFKPAIRCKSAGATRRLHSIKQECLFPKEEIARVP